MIYLADKFNHKNRLPSLMVVCYGAIGTSLRVIAPGKLTLRGFICLKMFRIVTLLLKKQIFSSFQLELNMIIVDDLPFVFGTPREIFVWFQK